MDVEHCSFLHHTSWYYYCYEEGCKKKLFKIDTDTYDEEDVSYIFEKIDNNDHFDPYLVYKLDNRTMYSPSIVITKITEYFLKNSFIFLKIHLVIMLKFIKINIILEHLVL